MASQSYRASDHQEWDAAGLDAIMNKHEMEYCDQEDDGFQIWRGEWYVADDDTRTIISGTFGNYNSPGASHCTYAEVYDDEGEYRAALAEWEAKPEYLESEDEAGEGDEGADGPVEEDYATTDHRRVYGYGTGRTVCVVPEGEKFGPWLKAFMEADGYVPDVWFISDHGNAHLIDLDE